MESLLTSEEAIRSMKKILFKKREAKTVTNEAVVVRLLEILEIASMKKESIHTILSGSQECQEEKLKKEPSQKLPLFRPVSHEDTYEKTVSLEELTEYSEEDREKFGIHHSIVLDSKGVLRFEQTVECDLFELKFINDMFNLERITKEEYLEYYREIGSTLDHFLQVSRGEWVSFF